MSALARVLIRPGRDWCAGSVNLPQKQDQHSSTTLFGIFRTQVPNPTVPPVAPVANHAVRADWVYEVCTLLQRAACEAAFSDHPEGALLTIVPSLPLPANRAEELALSGLLLQSMLASRSNSHDGVARQIRVLASLARRRPALSIAQRAADYITQRSDERLLLPRMARALACEETRLRREFKAEYGISPREYHQRVRVQRALMLMVQAPAKGSAVARTVGYASESHFYKTVRRFTGKTPAALHASGRDDLSELAARLLPLGARARPPAGRGSLARTS